MFALWEAAVTTASACAGLVHTVDELAESDHGEVVFEVEADGTTVSYQIGYVGVASEFGWVIPVPGGVDDVTDGDPALFEALRGATGPQVVTAGVAGGGGGGCSVGCGSGAKAGGDRGSSTANQATVVLDGFTGTFDFVVVRADDVSDLTAWLDEHGWSGLDATDLAHYTDLASDFVAVTLRPDISTTPVEGRDLPPLSIHTTSPELRFPSVMARHGDVTHQRTTVWVAGASRAVVSGWASQDPEYLPTDGLDPVVAFLATIGGIGDDRAFLRSWAGDVDGMGFVTRFDTYAPLDVHDEDAVFGLEASTEPLQTVIDVTGSATASAGLLGLLGLFALRRHNNNARPIEK